MMTYVAGWFLILLGCYATLSLNSEKHMSNPEERFANLLNWLSSQGEYGVAEWLKKHRQIILKKIE